MYETDDYALLSAMKEADWAYALSLLRSGSLSWSSPPLPEDVPYQLIELNAPAELVVLSLLRWARDTRGDINRSALLDQCMVLSHRHSNAFATFTSLLGVGLSANGIAEGGCTLLQRAISLNLVSEARELLRYGVSANQMSVFGLESTSNIEEAAAATNQAGAIVLQHFASSTGHQSSDCTGAA